ncbi:MAG: hypothetical protein EAZ97_13595 [Bacteroidetes bacterium]|nr:MAG: hypothetical protein EAZ97_13595 [Bacteroidota bacterium]
MKKIHYLFLSSLLASGSLMAQDAKNTDGRMVINDNATCTNHKENKVTLKLDAVNAKEMMLSNTANFVGGGVKWETFSPAKEWKMAQGDGTKTVYVKFKDNAGKESKMVSASIILDTQAPIPGTITMNKGETLVRYSDVLLNFTAKGADYMWVANDKNFSKGTWEPYEAKKQWNLEDGEGKRTVFVKFKDSCGNEVMPISATVTVDYDE